MSEYRLDQQVINITEAAALSSKPSVSSSSSSSLCACNDPQEADLSQQHTCLDDHCLESSPPCQGNDFSGTNGNCCCQCSSRSYHHHCRHQRMDVATAYIDNEDQSTCSHASTCTTNKRDQREPDHQILSTKKTQRKSRMPSSSAPLDHKPKPSRLATSKSALYDDDHLPLGGQYQVSKKKRKRRRRKRCAIGKGIVYLVFVMIILGGIAAFFCWPRTPMVIVGSHAERQDPSQGTTWATTMEKRPWMEAAWLMNVTLDNRDNWIPTRVTKMEMTMLDSLTQQSFATASVDDLALAPKTLIVLPNIVFHARYSARTDTDTTWQDLYRACGPQQNQGADKASLNINIKIVFHFLGILWTSTVTASPPSGGFVCPS